MTDECNFVLKDTFHADLIRTLTVKAKQAMLYLHIYRDRSLCFHYSSVVTFVAAI